MGNKTENSWYWDFVNLQSTVNQKLIKGGIDLQYIRYIKDIVNTRIGMFTYKNLPEPLTSQILETALMFMNNLCFYYSKGLNKWVLARYLFGGDYDMYFKPDVVEVLALNGRNLASSVPYKDLILVRDNTMDIVPFLVVQDYIKKISYLEDKMDKMVNIATFPVGIVGDKKIANQLKLIAKELCGNNPCITGSDQIMDTVKSFDIKLPYNPLDIYELKNKYRNECMASLGIYSVEEKRERMIDKEVSVHNDYTDYVYNNALEERKRFVAELNKIGDFKIELVETYEVNRQADIDEEAEKAGAIVKAQAEALKSVDPDALSGGAPKPSINKDGPGK